MDKGITIFFVIILVIICMCLGALAFYFLQGYIITSTECPTVNQQEATLNQSEQQELSKLRLLESNLTSSIIIFGQISKIDGSELTLTSGTTSAIIPLTPDTKIYTTNKTGQQVEIQLSDVKVGESIQVAVRLSPIGDMVGYSAMIVE